MAKTKRFSRGKTGGRDFKTWTFSPLTKVSKKEGNKISYKQMYGDVAQPTCTAEDDQVTSYMNTPIWNQTLLTFQKPAYVDCDYVV